MINTLIKLTKIALGLLCCCYLVTVQAEYYYNFSHGFNKHDPLLGNRYSLQTLWLDHDQLKFFHDTSISTWKSYGDKKTHMSIVALGATAKLYFLPIKELNYATFFIELSCGASNISKKDILGKRYGSKLNFQDIFGIGLAFEKPRAQLGLQYIHYSNAAIVKPNPGIDLFPMLYFSIIA